MKPALLMAKERLAAALGRMDNDQLWALKITIATERRPRTNPKIGNHGNAIDEAQDWALENIK